jgi:hypothetical protein
MVNCSCVDSVIVNSTDFFGTKNILKVLFQVTMAVSVKNTFFCDVTTYSLVRMYCRLKVENLL